MNPMGFSFLILATATLVFGFIPILTWTNLFIGMPLAIISTIMTGMSARKPHAQPADRALYWFSIAITALIVLRVIAL